MVDTLWQVNRYKTLRKIARKQIQQENWTWMIYCLLHSSDWSCPTEVQEWRIYWSLWPHESYSVTRTKVTYFHSQFNKAKCQSQFHQSNCSQKCLPHRRPSVSVVPKRTWSNQNCHTTRSQPRKPDSLVNETKSSFAFIPSQTKIWGRGMGWEMWRESMGSTAGPKSREQADRQLGNASKPDLKAQCEQSNHSWTTCAGQQK